MSAEGGRVPAGTALVPSSITLHQKSRLLEIAFSDGRSFKLPYEFLRVHSPSAEVRGHGLSEPLLVRGKERVNITAIEPVGNYAVKLSFDDGHDTGLYSWDFLRELGVERERNWARYQERLAAAQA